MIRTLLVLGITLAAASPARADLTHKIMSSISLQVGGAVTSAERIGSSFSISGSGVDTTDGSTANTISAGTITSGVYSPGTIAATQDTPGEAFSFSQSYTQGDAVPTSAVTTGETPNFGSIVSTAAGTAGSLAGTIASDGTMTITAGGANTLAIGQLTSELTIK
jgi:hypothetical protein